MATKTVFITSGTTFTIPLDFQSVVAVHAIGGGGGGYYCGGGGGAYAQSTAVTGLVAGGTAYCSLGAGGTENGTNGGVTWFNSSISTVPAGASQGAYADSGKSTQAENVNPAGGLASSSVGTLKKNGGSGAVGVGNNEGGAGGAGGPDADGLNGVPSTGGQSGAGGSGNGGTNGGGAGGAINIDGGAGTTFTQTSNSATAGPGGGGGGDIYGGIDNDSGGNGGLYGAGGGGWSNSGTRSKGAQGLIVFQYDDTPPIAPAVSTFFLLF